MLNIRVLTAYIYIGFFSFKAYGQDVRVADSLVNLLNKEESLSDTVLLQLYQEIAFNSISPEQIIFFAQKGLDIARKLEKSSGIAQCFMNLGDGRRLNGDLAGAVEAYLHSANTYIELNNGIGLSSAYLNLGTAYMDQGDFSNSRLYFLKSIQIFRQHNDSIRLATVLLNTGELFRKHGKLDSAIVYFQESGKIFLNKGYMIGSAYNLGNMGMVYEQHGAFQQAEEKLTAAIRILEDYQDLYAISSYMISLARVYQELGQYEKALNCASSAYKSASSEGLKEQVRDASLQLSKVYNLKKDFELAFHFQSQYISYRDSINNEETIRKMADLRTEYEVGQKQAEVDLLNSQTRTQKIILIAISIVLVLVFILVYVLYKLFKLRERAIRIAKERRQVITAQRNRLEELNHTKDRFFSIISHDIRGPVNNFHGVAQLIHYHVESGELDELTSVAKLLDRSSTELSSLLDNLLDWAMNQQGKFPYRPELLDLSVICNSNLTMMENMAVAKEIAMNREVNGSVTVFADHNSVSTIVRNLLSNALKFTNKGGKVELTIGQEDDKAFILVSDTGVGIPQEKMDGLFGFRGERSRWGTAGEKGVGLGLNLVHEFVELNHGKLQVDSEEGKGTQFKVYLPLGQME